MAAKKRIKGMEVEGNSIDAFYGAVTIFKCAEISLKFSKDELLRV
jgi:hypothetical protein